MKIIPAKNYEDAINKLTENTVLALGVKEWVVVTKDHPLLKSVRHFDKNQALSMTENQAIEISKSPYISIL